MSQPASPPSLPAGQTPRITARQMDALVAISSGAGTFHRLVGDALERLGLAVPFPTIHNMLIGCNAKFANQWALTPEGVRLVAALTRKAA